MMALRVALSKLFLGIIFSVQVEFITVKVMISVYVCLPSICDFRDRSSTNLSDTLNVYFYEQKQVRFFDLIVSISPTTFNFTKGYSNAQVRRVYKYPSYGSITTCVRFGLRVTLVFQKSGLYRFGYNFVTNSVGVFPCAMVSPPRSGLDTMFQSEALPICLEERPSASLVQALHRTLAGKLLTAKRPSVANLTLSASRLWNCAHRLSCYDHGKCLYSFEFTFAPDVEKVVAGGPWYINGELLLISRMNPNQSIEQLPFSFAKLWVRCYDLQPKCFTKDYAEAIGNSLGKFCDTDLPPEDPDEARLLVRKTPTVRKYLRVKFDFNLYGPLKSTQSIKICNSKKVVVEEHISRLTYERLPHTCFRCGFVGHLVVNCPYEGSLLYGEWIRAEKFFRINLQNAAPISNTVSINNENLGSTSQNTGIRANQVSNLADLVNNLVNDPTIIKADFRVARSEGALPPSKGKAPMITPGQSCLIPYTTVSPPKSVSPSSVYGPQADSVMGPIPSFLRNHSSPMASDTILIDGDEGQFASYLNSISSHADGFATNTSRCLFANDQSMPPLSTSIQGLTSTPMIPIPIKIVESAANISGVSSGPVSNITVGRKRAPNPQTPRPKRGRQTAPSEAPG